MGDEKVVAEQVPPVVGYLADTWPAYRFTADSHPPATYPVVRLSDYASLLEEKNQVAAERDRLRSPFTEEQGRELRDFVQPKEDAPTTITHAQWDAICGFVREGDRVEDALRERMLDAESQLAELRGRVGEVETLMRKDIAEFGGCLKLVNRLRTLAAADGTTTGETK